MITTKTLSALNAFENNHRFSFPKSLPQPEKIPFHGFFFNAFLQAAQSYTFLIPPKLLFISNLTTYSILSFIP